MGDLLSINEIISGIDQGGDRDGVATLEDVRPHLDGQQKFPLAISSDLNESEQKFRRALSALNRICGLPTDTFHMPSVLSCPVIQHNKIDLNKLRETEAAFAKTQFDRAFNNKNSDDTVRARYKEFLLFVETNHIPFSELFNVLLNVNYFTVPFETVVSQEVFFSDDQKRCLLQLSLYAALWHLKYNVKAFSPEELVKYPEWFRRKVEGFEDFMLPLLKDAKMDVVIDNKKALGFVYDYKNDVILSPSKNPLPPLSIGFLETAWHELFHYYGDRKFGVKPVWMEERDAELIAACAILKMLGITTTKDERFAELIASITEKLRKSQNEREVEELKQTVKEIRLLYEYALALLYQGENRKKLSTLEKAVNATKARHVLLNVLVSIPPLGLITDLQNREATISSILSIRSRFEEDLKSIRSQTYPWPTGNGQSDRISFFELAKRLHEVGERNSHGLDTQTVEKYYPYEEVVVKYVITLAAWEMCGLYVDRLRKGEDIPKSWMKHEFVKTYAFVAKYRSAFWVLGNH